MSTSWILPIVIIVPILCALAAHWLLRKCTKSYAQVYTKTITQPATQLHESPPGRLGWYSSYRFAGSVRHVALFVGNNKYEIRQNDETNKIKFTTRSYPGTVDAKSFNISTHIDDDLGPTSEDIGAFSPFSLRLGPRQVKLQFNMIGRATMNDSEITRFCKAIDETWVHGLLSNYCQHFAFMIASGLIKPKDRSPVWDILFGPKPEEIRILEKVVSLESKIPEAYALIVHEHDSTAHGATSANHGVGLGGFGTAHGHAPTAFLTHHRGYGGHGGHH
jgi:hypothetical protein